MQSDFQTMLESAENITDIDELDEVGLSLLVAAKHEQLLYDISHWGEDADVASKATFSRKKTQLEKQGLLETEKVGSSRFCFPGFAFTPGFDGRFESVSSVVRTK